MSNNMRADSSLLSIHLRAFIASRLANAVDMYFPHDLFEAEITSGAAFNKLLLECLSARDRRDFDFICQKFMASFGNAHTEFHDSWLTRTDVGSLGFYAAPCDERWTVRGSRLADVHPGEEIESIDGQPIEEFYRERREYISASTEHYAAASLFVKPHLFPSTFVLRLTSGKSIEVSRGGVVPQARGVVVTKEAGICQLTIPSFAGEDHETVLEKIRTSQPFDRLLIDLRGNGGGNTPIDLLRRLVPGTFRLWREASVVHVAVERAIRLHQNCGAVSGGNQALSKRAMMSQPAAMQTGDDAAAFRGPIVIVQDALTASAAEDFIFSLKDAGRATLVGTTTGGSSGQPYFEDFGNGMSFRVAAKAVCFPDGARFEGVGIAPDYLVENTPEAWAKGEDLVLTTAMAILSEMKDR